MTFKADPLEPAAFDTMLRQGRGRALMHVLEYGLDGVEELVLQACLANQTYDSQCEPDRSPWLYRMFKGTPHYPRFSDAILTALPQASDDDIAQLRKLAALMGIDGDAAAASTLRDYVLAQDFAGASGPFGCQALVMLDGIAAIAELGRRFGRCQLADPQAFVEQPDDLMDGFENDPAALASLDQLAVHDPALAIYLALYRREVDDRWRGTELERRQKHRDRVRKQYPIDAVLAAAAAQGMYRSAYRSFGMYASDDELATVLQHLLAATTPEHCLRLLWVFANTALPRLEPRLLELAEHTDLQVRQAAQEALSHTRDPALARLARKHLADTAFSVSDSALLGLFNKNLAHGDDELILARLDKLTCSDFDMHQFTCRLVDIGEEAEPAAVVSLAEWAYQRTPCSVCRRHAVERLQAIAMLSPAIAEECGFDANPSLHTLALSGAH